MFRVDPATAGAFVVALLISLGRPYLGMHYPSDVLAGALLGAILGRLIPGLDEPPASSAQAAAPDRNLP
jgi:membrane-associated phospholipid phosphatase